MDLMSLNISGIQLMEFAFSGYGGHYRLTNHSGLWSEDYGREVCSELEDKFALKSSWLIRHLAVTCALAGEDQAVIS